MVRRQVRQVWREEEEEVEEVSKVVMTDHTGKTNIKSVEKVLNDKLEVLLWTLYIILNITFMGDDKKWIEQKEKSLL